MKEDCRSLVAALSVNMLTINMLLSVFFVPGVLAGCGNIVPHLFITAPKNLEALSGSCLQIPCSFTTDQKTFDSRGTIYAIWMKNQRKPENVVYNSSKSENRYQMNITGNLSQKNCTTLFYHLNTSQTDKYFFRIENGPVRASACADPLQITVKDSAWSPRINISGDLKEKESVTITCSAFTACPHSPPELTWNLQQHSHRQIEENKDGTFISKIQETITLSDSHDGYNISCSVTYPVDGGKRVKSAQTEVTLSVSYAPKDTSASISPSGLVSAGSWVNLSCSSRAKPPVSSFTWFQSSKGGAVRVAEGHFYRLNVTEMTDTGSYYCVAANVLGNHTSSWNHLEIEGTFPLTALITGILLIVLIFLVICAWNFRSKDSNPQHSKSQTGEEVCSQVPTNQMEEDLQYEDMSLFRRRPGPSSVSVRTVNSSAQPADDPEDLYAQSHAGEELVLQTAANKTEEELDYVEMKIFKERPEPSSFSEQDSKQHQGGVKTQVNVSAAETCSAQTNTLESLYSQVMKTSTSVGTSHTFIFGSVSKTDQ